MQIAPKALRPLKLTRIGLALSCLTLCLAACASKPDVPISVPTPVGPPNQFLRDCVARELTGNTNAALVTHINDLREALALCNADKAALRAWSDSLAKSSFNQPLTANSVEKVLDSQEAGLKGRFW